MFLSNLNKIRHTGYCFPAKYRFRKFDDKIKNKMYIESYNYFMIDPNWFFNKNTLRNLKADQQNKSE